jgi:hypothetical protein
MEDTMTDIDYMKVLDIAAQTMDTSSKGEVQALDLSIFKSVITKPDGSKIEITLKIHNFDLEIFLDKKTFSEKELDKWLNKFEYQLEQNFFKNITITHSENKTEYRIKIVF